MHVKLVPPPTFRRQTAAGSRGVRARTGMAPPRPPDPRPPAPAPRAQVLRGHMDAVWALRYNRLARRAVTGSVDCAVRVWDGYADPAGGPAADGGAGDACVAELRCHLEPVMSLAVDPGRAVSADSAGWIFLWDFEAGPPPPDDDDPDGGGGGGGGGAAAAGCEYRALMSHCGPG